MNTIISKFQIFFVRCPGHTIQFLNYNYSEAALHKTNDDQQTNEISVS